mgnify:CR=1 FL=1
MKYVSTRGAAPELTFEDAMLTGLARDGGLYVPAQIPTLDATTIAGMAGQSYEEVAYTVMRPFVGDVFSDTEFREIIARAYTGFGHAARAPLVQMGRGHFLLELFHGPTLAFKDFAMQLIGQLFQTALARRGERLRETREVPRIGSRTKNRDAVLQGQFSFRPLTLHVATVAQHPRGVDEPH